VERLEKFVLTMRQVDQDSIDRALETIREASGDPLMIHIRTHHPGAGALMGLQSPPPS